MLLPTMLFATLSLGAFGEILDLLARIDVLRQFTPPAVIAMSAWLPPECWRLAVVIVAAAGLAWLYLAPKGHKGTAGWVLGLGLLATATCFASSRAAHPLDERRLTESEQRNLMAVLNTCRSCAPVAIFHYPNRESERFADDIRRAFVNVYWTPPMFKTLPRERFQDDGVYFVYRAEVGTKERETADQLCEKLRATIADADCVSTATDPTWSIFVGRRRQYPEDAD